ncbi:MAG: methyltransferase domain-containing protein [Betaproteobacteria bacterium]
MAALPHEVGERMLERTELVKLIDGPILDAGCATGLLARKLARRYPRVPLIALDPAREMIALGRTALPVVQRVLASLSGIAPRWVCGDVADLPIRSRSLALIWSNLMLQGLPEPAAAFREWHRTLKPGGLLMFSTLGPDSLKELRNAFAAADRRHHVQPFVDMHDLGDQLMAVGFADPVMDMETISLTYASARALLHELHDLGSVNGDSERNRGLTGKRAWTRMINALESDMRECRIGLTFEIVYGHAWKTEQEPSHPADGSRIVQLHRKPRR